MKIASACDHAGCDVKNEVIKALENEGHVVTDHGCYTSESVNYPDYAHKVCKAVQDREATLGILICGTGIGMSMAANKHVGIRAAVCTDEFCTEMTRRHNDANVLCFGERVVGIGTALDLVDAFLDAQYLNNGNHVTRVAMLSDIENKN